LLIVMIVLPSVPPRATVSRDAFDNLVLTLEPRP